jgi:DNA processing protein
VRNRLISGLALAVLVTEAPQGSGALITTRYGAEQGRDVLAVPGNITSRGSHGANKLIQDGARLVLETADVLAELNLHTVPDHPGTCSALCGLEYRPRRKLHAR